MPERSIIDKIKGEGVVKHFAPGEQVVGEREFTRAIPFIISGSVRVMRTDEEGREILLYYIKPGESCVMSFLAGMQNDTSKLKAVAEEESDVVFIGWDKMKEWMRTNPDWVEFIFRMYHKRFEELLEVINSIAFRKLDNRILEFLKKKSELIHSKEISITHQQLAEEIGSSREVVSRLLKQMENERMVKLSRNKITLV